MRWKSVRIQKDNFVLFKKHINYSFVPVFINKYYKNDIAMAVRRDSAQGSRAEDVEILFGSDENG